MSGGNHYGANHPPFESNYIPRLILDSQSTIEYTRKTMRSNPSIPSTSTTQIYQRYLVQVNHVNATSLKRHLWKFEGFDGTSACTLYLFSSVNVLAGDLARLPPRGPGSRSSELDPMALVVDTPEVEKQSVGCGRRTQKHFLNGLTNNFTVRGCFQSEPIR